MDNLFMIRRAEEELDAEEVSTQVLCDLIGMAPPKLWPPITFDQKERDWARGKLKEDPENADWIAQYVAVRLNDTNCLVGCAGFDGKPGSSGTLQMRYAITLEHQLQGYATAAVALLLRLGFMSPDVELIKASVPSTVPAALRVLEKNGFKLTGKGGDAGELSLYQIDRNTFMERRAARA